MNWIISYPRSGNTWIRYCIEYVTKKPTIGYFYEHKTIDNPLGSLEKEMNISIQSFPLLVKRHNFLDVKNIHDNIILIVRDYKESIVRHIKSFSTEQFKKNTIEKLLTEQTNYYLELIKDFDIVKNNKLVLYYEDFIINPIINIEKLLSFINENFNKEILNEFSENLDFHRKRCIDIYEKYQAPSLTKGENLNYHSQNSNNNELKIIEKIIKSCDLYDKYLIRY